MTKLFECKKCTKIGIQYVIADKKKYEKHLQTHNDKSDTELEIIIHGILGDNVYKGS